MMKAKRLGDEDKLGQSVEIVMKPIQVLGRFDLVDHDDPNQYNVLVDGKLVTDGLKTVILKGIGWIK